MSRAKRFGDNDNHASTQSVGIVRCWLKPADIECPLNIEEPPDAKRIYERYLALARAQALSGDLIAAENYYQHAEHYFRSMSPDRRANL